MTAELTHTEAVVALAEGWSNNWLWSMPLIVLTVLAHCFGLIEIREHVVRRLLGPIDVSPSRAAFGSVAALTVLLLTGLHAIEGGAWAFAYVALGASADPAAAMLYSLSAMTSYGHADIFLAPHWQMMGALEALNGMMLFGLSTAFLYGVLQNHWPTHGVLKKGAKPLHDPSALSRRPTR